MNSDYLHVLANMLYGKQPVVPHMSNFVLHYSCLFAASVQYIPTNITSKDNIE